MRRANTQSLHLQRTDNLGRGALALAGRFHDKLFDDATKLKLEIFRGYLQEWIPVFLTPSNRRPYVNIYDFFAGPGYDSSGNPGSPLIIIDEITRYLDDPTRLKAAGAQVRLFFNDASCENAERLKLELAKIGKHPGFSVQVTSMDFRQALAQELPAIRDKDSANLIILDQCGYSQIDSAVFSKLARCPATDIMIFISSSHIRRFVEEESTQQYFQIPKDKMQAVPPNDVHRFICSECFQAWIPSGTEYHLAPFSIKKDESGNIYGLIFGSGSLLGLEKFLRVCWNKDKVTGEANFNIDRDALRDGQPSLFEEYNVFKKHDRFRRDTIKYMSGGQCDNLDVYRFCLRSGFLPQHMRGILKELQDSGDLDVKPAPGNEKPRKRAFYISWEYYKHSTLKVLFEYRGEEHADI